MESLPPRLFILDGMALAYRSYFAFISAPLRNSRGENTSAIFGFVNTLLKILDDDKPEYIAVAFDRKEPTFRHIKYPSYKAHREEIPEELLVQLSLLREVVRAFNVPVLELAGFEADDIMGTVARRAEKQKICTYLITSDKDMMQLISPFIKMYKPGSFNKDWEIVDYEHVMKKFGVPPAHVIDVLGLIGDKSDNVPGVPGVGEKTAIPLVQQYGSVENILANVENISQAGVRKKFTEFRELALLSKELVTIDINVPLDVEIEQLKASRKNVDALVQLFTRLEFRHLLGKIQGENSGQQQGAREKKQEVIEEQKDRNEETKILHDIISDEHSYHLIKTKHEFLSLVKKLAMTERFVFDTETTSENPFDAALIGVSFCVQEREAYFVALQFQQKENMVAEEPLGDLFTERKPVLRTTMHNAQLSNDDSELSPEFFAEHLRPVFANEHIIKIAQNLKYDAMVLENYGIAVRGKSEDTMIAHFVYRNDARHGLDAMAMELMHYKMIAFDELLENGKEKKKIWEVPLQQLCDYSAQDADITMRLYNILKEKMHGALWNVCTTIDFPLVPVLAAMERTGQKIDVEFLQILSKELQRNLSLTEKEIFQYAGDAFNINSPKQLQEILFTKLQLQTGRKTKTGFSTDVNALEEIRAAHPIVEKLLEYRTLSKLKSTYVDAIPLLLRQDTARVHTTYNQIVAATGRLSSSDPNLQNIPIRTELGRSIRKAFITENGWKIIAADYSQIELRIMAHISGDEGLQEAFRNGEDIHSTTAEKLFGETSLDKREKRRRAKEINFGIMYGMGAYGLSDSLNVTQLEAKEIISKYFERFPKVREFIETTKEFARTNGYVETLCGRRRYLPDIFSKNATVRSNAERQAINAPIQGTAADMIKLAMIDIHREITKRNDVNEKAHLLLQVHDELVFEVEESIETIAKKIISDGMKNALALSVPVEVDWGSGSNWFEAS